MPLNWQSPTASITGKQRTAGTARPGSDKNKYTARAPTATEFSRTWSTIGNISAADKIRCLERCDDKYSKEALMQWAQDEDALDAMVWVATGWQPGLELFERDRDTYFLYFQRQHSRQGYPLRAVGPQECIAQAEQQWGKDRASGGLQQPPHQEQCGEGLQPLQRFLQECSQPSPKELLVPWTFP